MSPKKILPIVLSISALIAIHLFFFRSQLAGKILTAPDEVNYQGASSEKHNETHQQSLWTNSMFSGMPTYQIDKLPLGWSPFDLIRSAFGLFMNPMLSYFIAMALLCYLSLMIMGIGPWLSALGAFAVTFTSGHFIVAAAGHYTKLEALVYLPLILIGFHLIFSGRRMIGLLLFTMGLLFNIQANHVQMTYYIMISLLIYGIIEWIYALRSKAYNQVWKSSAVAVLGVLLSISGNIAHLYTMHDYTEDTVRGKRILRVSLPDQSKDATTGLDWQYASDFSNGYLDLISMVIPGFVGGSMKEKISTTSALAEDFNKNNKKVSDPFFAPLYWGSLPASSGPDYIGIISFILFCIGLVYIRSNIKYWAWSAFLLMVVLSLGRHFFLNRYLFEYLPFYNKFRSLNSILLVASAIVPVFGIFTLDRLLQSKIKQSELIHLFKITVLPLFVVMILISVAGCFIFDFSNPSDKNFWPNANALADTRMTYMVTSTIRSLFIGIFFVGVLYLTLLNKLDKKYFYVVLAVLLIWDLVPIARRCMPEQDYKVKRDIEESLSKSSGDVEILRDRDIHYRVMDKANNTFNDAYASLYHKSIGGYHPAKLRRYQDLIDEYLSKGNSGVIDMLNTKYIITSGGSVTINKTAAGNAWFVDSIIKVHTPDEEFKSLKSIPIKSQAAVLDNEFPNYFDQSRFTPNGNITLIEYHPDQLIYKSNSTSPQAVVFSEIWYGPEKGWHATVDGQAVAHIRVDYALRALKVPAGVHTIEFKFYPDKVFAAIKINRIILWTLFVGLLGGIAYSMKQVILPSVPSKT